jgi:hypothetical protein
MTPGRSKSDKKKRKTLRRLYVLGGIHETRGIQNGEKIHSMRVGKLDACIHLLCPNATKSSAWWKLRTDEAWDGFAEIMTSITPVEAESIFVPCTSAGGLPGPFTRYYLHQEGLDALTAKYPDFKNAVRSLRENLSKALEYNDAL